MKKLRKFMIFAMIPIMAISVLSVNLILPSRNKTYAATSPFPAGTEYVVTGGLDVDLVTDPKGKTKSGGWQTEYDLGDTFTPDAFPTDTYLLVKYPDGSAFVENEADARALTFDVAGYYTAVYNKDLNEGVAGAEPNYKPVTKEFKFKVAAENYQIELPFNGAEIPSLITRGAKFKLPKASVIYTDEKDEMQLLNDPAIEVTVTTVNADWQENGMKNGKPFSYKKDTPVQEITAPQAGGKIFISYFYGADMKAVIQKDYTVTITESINDKLSPTLSASGMPTDVALMTKLTLPTASASDDQDKNVKIEVSIKTPTGGENVYKVKENMLDQYMVDNNAASVFIADKYKNPADAANYYAKNDDLKVTFDNKRDMTFYPDQKGTYEITYTATNDIGKTAVTTFRVNVEDSEMPYIKVQPKEIPGTWTNNTLIKQDPADTDKEKKIDDRGSVDMRLYFPKPAFADNASLESEMKAKADNVRIELIKGSTALEVLTFKSGAYESNKTGTETIIVTTENRFYIPATKLDSGVDYEIAYFVSDTASPLKYAEKRFAVKIASEVKDLLAPKIDFIDKANTVKLGGKFTKPIINISDNSGTLVEEDIIYALTNRPAADIKTDPFIKTGDFDFTGRDDLFYKNRMEKFSIKAIDPSVTGTGFGTGAGQYDKIVMFVYAEDGVGNKNWEAKTINIIDTAEVIAAPVFDGSVSVTCNGVDVSGATVADGFIELKSADASGKFKAQDYIIIEGIKAEQAGIKDIYIGYEFVIRNADGAIVGANTTTTSWIDIWGANTVLNIDEFKVKAENVGVGKFTLTLSVFNVSGAARSVNFTFETLPGKSGGTQFSADAVMDIPEAFDYGRVIELPNPYYVDENGDIPADPFGGAYDSDYQYKRTISGPHYSLQGFELLALQTGDYKITLETKNSTPRRYEYETKVNDTVGPDIKLTGVIPTVSIDRDKDIFLPGMMRSDLSGIDTSNWTRTVSVNNGGTNGWAKLITKEIYDAWNTEKPDYITENNIKVGMYYFSPKDIANNNKIDGNYTIAYQATDNNGQVSTLSFVIQIGDVFTPVIKLNAGNKTYSERMKKGAKFIFLDFTATDETYVKEGNTWTFKPGVDKKSSVKITLTAPDGSVLLEYSNWTTSKKYENYTTTLDKAGEYVVTYSVTDDAGNEGTLTYRITVFEKPTGGLSSKALAAILIAAGVLLIAGIAFYFVKFRRKAQ